MNFSKSIKIYYNINFKLIFFSVVILGILSIPRVSEADQWQVSGNNIHYNTGSVGIGTDLTNNPNNYKLAVNGIIGAKALSVRTNISDYPDYVFEESYNLRPIFDVEKYIKENGHLPEVPSAKEIGENGVSVGKMQNTLLKKIEELTLYVIEQNKKIENQIKIVDIQNNEIIDLKSKVSKLKK